MLPASFDYHRPTSLDQVLTLLAELGEDARLLAGGHSLIPAMKFRLAQPAALVDLGGVSELQRIEERDGQIAIGAMATHDAVVTHPGFQANLIALTQASAVIGGRSRRMSTSEVVVKQVARSVASQVGTQVGKALMRGFLGSLTGRR